MKIGDIITKEQFLKLAPLGLTALSSSTNTLIGYCPKAAATYTATVEGPLNPIPGYVLLNKNTKEAEAHIRGHWNYISQGAFKIHTLPNMPLLKRRSL